MDDACSFLAPQADGCRAPRPCVDCLLFNVDSELAGCLVNAVGKCVAVAGNYDAALDFRDAGASNNISDPRLARLQFRASDATYCDVDDALCAQCRIAVFPKVHNNPNSSSGGGGSTIDPAAATTAFCYGSNNCVCIAACESTRWSEIVGGTKCFGADNSTDTSSSPDDGGMKAWETSLVVIAALLVILIAAVCLKGRGDKRRAPSSVWTTILERCRKKAPEQRADPDALDREEQDGTDKEAESGPKREGLSLFGWRSMREELIDNETHRLAQLDGEQTPGAGFIQFADTTPSAPYFEDEMEGSAAALAKPSAPSHEL